MTFITQDKTNIKYLLIVVILAAIVGGGVLWCIYYKPIPICGTPFLPRLSVSEVTIVTDKTEYEEGETVKITVRNNLNEGIKGTLKIERYNEKEKE